MTQFEIEEYMRQLNVNSQAMDRSPSEQRRKLFQQMVDTAPKFSTNQFLMRGLKGTFGLSNQHRINISNTMKAKHKNKQGALS
jgi:hypothetical protein